MGSLKRKSGSPGGLIVLTKNEDGETTLFNAEFSGKFPDQLFRLRAPKLEYLRDEILRGCSTGEIFTSKFDSFADPGEVRPVVTRADDEDYISVISECLQHDPTWLFPDIELDSARDFFQMTSRNVRRSMLEDRTFWIPRARIWASEDILRARSRARCACFLQKSPQMMMWDYYAAQGRGICLVLDLDRDACFEEYRELQNGFQHQLLLDSSMSDWEGEPSNHELAGAVAYLSHLAFGPVSYVDSPPAIRDLDVNLATARHPDKYLEQIMRMKIGYDFITKLFFSKSNAYAHEAEWRVLSKRGDDPYVRFVAYKPTRIILGPRALDQVFIAGIEEICSECNLELSRAIPDPENGFRLIEQRI